MKFVPSRKRNLFVSIPGRVYFLPVRNNNFIQVDCEPEMEGICLSCEFLQGFDERTIQELVPSQVRGALTCGHHVSINRFKVEELIKIRDEILKTMDPLRNKWISLLWAEQLQIEIDIRNYDLHDIRLKQRSSFVQKSRDGLSQYVDFVISVPDAPEQRPHVYVGMRVQLRPSEDRFYKNLKHVHESMKRNDRFVSPSCSFCTSSSSSSSSSGILTCDYCAEMETEAKMFLKFAERGRLNLEVHAAVQSRKDCDVTIRLCVPTREENTMTTLQMLRFLEWNVRFDTTMQRRSFSFMRNAMKDWKSKFGSDCTGKTMVVVEAASQALSQTDSSRVLIVAPSNAAVDVVLNRLHDTFLNHYIKTQAQNGYTSFRQFARRINAPTRMPSMIIGNAMLYSDIDPKSGTCFVPPRSDLAKGVRLVACTCACFGYLKVQGRLDGVFTHIIVDEASQAWEPETMIPLSLIEDKTRVMIAGDPKQLGPTTRCHKADRYGLGVSLQERLMSLPEYRQIETKRNQYQHLIQLNRNYRSHSSMLKIPSKRFYGGVNAILPCADPKKIDSSLSWRRLKGRKFPVMFLDVQSGRHHHTIDSRSLKNKSEARVVVDIVKEILNDTNLSFTTNDIGVVASFRAQVLLIRKSRDYISLMYSSQLTQYIKGTMLRNVGLNAIRVGSIDDYQGQEENVVIVSTVFAGPHLTNDSRGNDLGLLGNPRRFNVAVTRASSLLVVIGKSNSIRRDPCWKDLISLCVEMGTYEVIGGKVNGDDDRKIIEEEDDDSSEFPYDPSKNLENSGGFLPWRVMM
eukprot:g4944.t1